MNERAVGLVAHLAADQEDILQAYVACQRFDLPRRSQTASGGLNHDQESIDRFGRRPAEMLHAGIHIEQDDLIAPKQDVRDQ